MTLIAFFAGCLLTALVFAYRDRAHMVDADLAWVTEHEERMRALAPVVPLAPRPRSMSSIEFLLGHQSRGTSWTRADRPTPTAGTGLAAVGEFEPLHAAIVEQSAKSCGLTGASKSVRGSAQPRRLSLVGPSGPARDLLRRANGPTLPGRPVH